MPFSHANPFEIFEWGNKHLLILCYLLSQYRLLRLLPTTIAQTFWQKKWREFRYNSSFMKSTTNWQKKKTKWRSLNGTINNISTFVNSIAGIAAKSNSVCIYNLWCTQEEKSLSRLFSYLLIFIFSLNITERIAKGFGETQY